VKPSLGGEGVGGGKSGGGNSSGMDGGETPQQQSQPRE